MRPAATTARRSSRSRPTVPPATTGARRSRIISGSTTPRWTSSERPSSGTVPGGHADLASFLIRAGAPVAPYSAQTIGLAAKASRKDLLDLLLANGADVRAVG